MAGSLRALSGNPVSSGNRGQEPHQGRADRRGPSERLLVTDRSPAARGRSSGGEGMCGCCGVRCPIGWPTGQRSSRWLLSFIRPPAEVGPRHRVPAKRVVLGRSGHALDFIRRVWLIRPAEAVPTSRLIDPRSGSQHDAIDHQPVMAFRQRLRAVEKLNPKHSRSMGSPHSSMVFP